MILMIGKNLVKRIDRLERILIDLAYFKGKYKYIYLSDLRKALKKEGLISDILEPNAYKIVYINPKKKLKNKKIME